MTTEQTIALTQQYLMTTYRRAPVAFSHGQGVWLVDLEGRRYLDFVGGIAVSALGHAHPVLVAAIQAQAARMLHVSNLYHIAEQAHLAQWLVEHSACDRAFFCNSGAEANEAAIKLSRKWGKRDGANRYEIIVAHQSFHGRTMATLAATMQPKYQEAFSPLPPGFVPVPFNDLEATRAAVTERTCAVLLEPIQGESGIQPATLEYLTGVRGLCDERGLLLMLDEVQTGIGRTGTLFAYEQYGIVPDVLTLAKGLGGGFPIGAMLARESAAAFSPGDHGSTFGGNPLACAAALAVLEVISGERLAERAVAMGAVLAAGLLALVDGGLAKAVRGRGLLLALELNCEAAPVVDACRRAGLLVNAVAPTALRFAPPLVVQRSEIEQALEILGRVLEAPQAPAGTGAPVQ
jgi:predicted acetylornithine/succinylornithine family transaminase